MDIGTVVGLLLGICLVLGSIVVGGGIAGILSFIDIPSMMIVGGGSIAAVLIAFPLQSVKGAFSIVKNCFFTKTPAPNDLVKQVTELAAIARRDGLLALEDKIQGITDPYMVRGMEMVIAGANRQDLENMMEVEINYIDERHKTGKKILEATSAYAPAFGMVGTLIGLVQMLQKLDDPSKIGAGMAVALLTTLYGAVVANLFCIPLAGKLEARNKDEIMVREMIMTALLSLVEGESPRVVQGRLQAYLASSARKDDTEKAA